LIDQHERWIARTQDNDFGIDLEAELARNPQGGDGDQEFLGKLVKIQVKGSESLRRTEVGVAVRLSRDYLDYAAQFRIPVVLVAVDVTTEDAWWVWLQDWILRNEKTLADQPSQASFLVDLGSRQTLVSGLDFELPAIASGEHPSSLVLALRELATTARATNSIAVVQGVFDILDVVDAPSRAWALERTIDSLVGMGPNAGFWQTQQYVPQLMAIVERVGGTFTSDQVMRLVRRGDTYSRAAIYALAKLYDDWSVHTASLRLPARFAEAGLERVAWYCSFREAYPALQSFDLWSAVADGRITTSFDGLAISEIAERRSEIGSRWPNVGDSIFLDMLEPVGP
jgi:hypothetical protein